CARAASAAARPARRPAAAARCATTASACRSPAIPTPFSAAAAAATPATSAAPGSACQESASAERGTGGAPLRQHLVAPVLDLVLADQALQPERIVLRERLGGGAGAEQRHVAAGRIGERADADHLAARH